MIVNAATAPPGYFSELVVETLLMVTAALWLVMTYRLVFAVAFYLRFRHAAAMVLSTQVILFLVACAALFVWGL